MATVAPATGPHPKVALFDRPKKRKQLREAEERRQEVLRKQAAQDAKDALKFETMDFLTSFLENSPFRDLAEQITITWEALPKLDELETYGELDKTEGTRACRKLFKAAVIWDDLGLCLWERLSSRAEERSKRREPKMEAVLEEEYTWEEELLEQERRASASSNAVPRMARHHSRSSRSSHDSGASSRSRQTSSDRENEKALVNIVSTEVTVRSPAAEIADMVAKTRSTCIARRSADPLISAVHRHHLPRMITNNCASAVRKTMDAFGDSMIQGHGGRGAI
ncbi:hypothetical protein G7046_g6614 [Stylonectria norvegica]|nr:hypothetical protein G7046_g6614 [Stylonectria norvegica]